MRTHIHGRWPVRSIVFAGVACAISAAPAFAEDDAAELAKKLSNPVAALISVPLQLNYDENLGTADEGERWSLNVQPVVPISLDAEWNLISRTILPLVSQKGIYPGNQDQSGIGDIVQSVFFSPKAPTASGWIWGAGPVLLLPTGSDPLLTADQWGAGPTGVALKQQGPWTYGVLANHLWSFGGNARRADINATFMQPFVSFATPAAWTFGLNTESTYDWENSQWSLPLNATVSKVTKLGSQLVSIGGGLRYWLESPEAGAEGFGFRLSFTLLFPK